MPTMLTLGLSAPTKVFVIDPPVSAIASPDMMVLRAREQYAPITAMIAEPAGLKRSLHLKPSEHILRLGTR